MTSDVKQGQNTERLVMIAIGAIAGLSFWVLLDVLPDNIENHRFIMGLSAFVSAFFASLLAVAGPLSLPKSLKLALAVSVIPALLIFWASFRFVDIGTFLSTGHPLIVHFVMVAVPVPFLIAAFGDRRDWRDYPELFRQSWNIVVRYAAAWIFVGLFWGMVFLSNELFQIIGLDVIEDILRLDAVPFILTGAVLGLALAVVNELSDYVSPYLVLQLLRLFLPVVLLVVLIFVIGVPFRGLSGLFGDLSAATVLLAMAMAAITLVSTAIDENDENAVSTRVMRGAAQGLALVLPILAGLSAYAIWARVDQYGWTPRRLAAATIALLVLGYALTYALAVLRRTNWMGNIRTANIGLALVTVAAAVLWLTPVLNPQRISTNSQLARYTSGKTEIRNLDLWVIGKKWGVSGAASLEDFATAVPDDAFVMEQKLAKLAESNSRQSFGNATIQQNPEQLQEFLALLPVRPAGKTVPKDVFTVAGDPRLWLKSCKRQTPEGNPGCIAIIADFLPENPADEVMFASLSSGNYVIVKLFSKTGENQWKDHGPFRYLDGFENGTFDMSVYEKLFTGAYSVGPSRLNTMTIDGRRFLMLP